MKTLVSFLTILLLSSSIVASNISVSSNSNATLNRAGTILNLSGSWINEDSEDFSYDYIVKHYNSSSIKCMKELMLCFESLAEADGNVETKRPSRSMSSRLKVYEITSWQTWSIRAVSKSNKNEVFYFDVQSGEVTLTISSFGRHQYTLMYATPIRKIKRVN